jgi:peptide subunit release factor 1 (eRF1)
MLGRGVLSRLHTLTEQESPTLTVYLDIDQNKQSNRNRGFLVQAEALLKDLAGRHRGDDGLRKACELALRRVEALEPQGKAALIVVHPASGLCEVHQVGLPFGASAHWRRGAFLRPIVEAMDEHERFAVVLTDNKRARLFTVYLGEITEHEDLLSDTGRRTRALGTDQWRAQKRHDRHHEEEVAWHVKRVIDALHDLALRSPFDRLVVAGTPKAVAQLERLLPRRLHGKLVETVSMQVSASKKEVLAKAVEVQTRMERRQEAALVDGLVAELHEGGKAVAGLDAVVDAVNQGRVWKLFYGKGFKAKGGECLRCGCFAAAGTTTCPFCGGDVQPVSQYVDRLSQRLLESGSHVEVVAGEASQRLAELGSVAALLRY